MTEIAPGLSLVVADCLDALRELEEASVDAVVCDPPYGLEFMGKEWDRPWAVSPTQSVGFEGREENLTLPAHRDGRNANCRTCGGRARGAKRCQCTSPDWDRHPREDMLAFQRWTGDWAEEALRVLKPGGHALVFGGTRTYHRMATGLEDAGFEIRDTLAWMFGSGFPKSLDVSKAIDKKAGVEGEFGAPKSARSALNLAGTADPSSRTEGWDRPWKDDEDAIERNARVYVPATDGAKQWVGWGTALKPAFEPIVVARKPLSGTVAANVLAHGVGALNIDGCRIEFVSGADEAESKDKNRHADFDSGPRENAVYGADERTRAEQGNYDASGRWPANVLLDEEAGALLDEQTGELAAGNHPALRTGRGDKKVYGPGWSSGTEGERRPTETGGASRFFYCAKVSRAERNAGLDGFEERVAQDDVRMNGGGDVRHKSGALKQTPNPHSPQRNVHPTVKPIALMRWLIRLVTPPGGLVVDPFTGSGSTGCAAALEGVRFLGIEREQEYADIATARIRFWAEHGDEALRVVADQEASERVREAIAETGQLDLLGSA